jgi:hypothetical protein
LLPSARLSRSERLTLSLLAVVSLVLRTIAFFHYRFDSDEPQHLHVAWGWTAGLVQYRDLFDNHAPLFHMATAPLLRLVGERPDVLLYMRLPMLPLFAIVLFCTWDLGRRFWSPRVALWAVVLLSLFPPFFLKSLEYRTDNLWNTLWMLALVLLLRGRLTLPRTLLAGLILGAALGVSLKTSLLVLTLGGAALLTEWLTRGRGERIRPGRAAMLALTLLAGLALIPSLFLAYFIHLGAWERLLFCVVRFNELVAKTSDHVMALRLLYPLTLGATLFIARRRSAGRTFDDAGRIRFFLALYTALFLATLVSFWILISPRDMLPIMPLVMLFVTSALFSWRWSASRPLLAGMTLALLMVGSIDYYGDRLRDRTEEQITMIRQVLGVTRPGELLMDYKGETIYRRRPSYYIFELITRRAMLQQLIPDTVFEDVVAARCYVAQADGPFWPPRSAALLSANFMDLGRIRAAGQWLHDDGSFTIAIPGPYTLLEHDGQARGTLDGQPFTSPRQLAAGPHRFQKTHGDRIAVLWAPAVERGYSPFHLRDREF